MKKDRERRSSLVGEGEQNLCFPGYVCAFFWLIEAEEKVEPWQVKKLSVN